ncbi:microtubule organization protein AKNA isoform X2 [Monodelphis domestica]|uniref:microtubule organization protein AKNA isoform X2 n=1 Tax=Monodelphis domestica TaxID=13616 RepID=UPI0024E1FF31|nr:microtubule organization protein AKNA isoform X2 [Monodelphis domestica]XP_007474576.2 microtubule organization protein AKNA isoform X2 [Monodelphis domestica]XP_007474577.2 microtubule organization protein AKNA isoform X2 [Monodelphis domestica]
MLGEPTWQRGPANYDENELEDIGSQGNYSSSLYGYSQQDHQLDMAEDGLRRASRDFLELQRTEYPGKGCPQGVYKRQFSSDYSISPTSLGEAQGGSDGSHYGQEEDRLSGHFDISLYPTSAPTGRNLRAGSVGSADSMPKRTGQFGDSSEYPISAPANLKSGSVGSADSVPESIDQFGDSLGYPFESETASSLDDVHLRIPRDESPQDHFLSPLSSEGQQHPPSADGKMNSHSSYEESSGSLMGAVTQTGLTSPQDFSNSNTHIPHSPGYKFGREEPNSSPFRCRGTQPLNQIKKPKKSMLHSQFSDSFCNFSPPKNSTPKGQNQSRTPKQGAVPAHSSSEISKYGRGQLNYPLPDFSKVEAKVRFPKDEESYRPPKGRGRSRQLQGSTRPLVFKSPAEIVREVLLSSGDGSSQKTSFPSYPVAKVPQEFKTPQQATELVQQLQEDYHKLLTKYAEAENTIDLLRLGAKVNLYSDPPKPSRGVQMGTMPHGTKVMSFTIPQARVAEWQSNTSAGPRTMMDPQLSATRGDLIPPSAASYPEGLLTDGSGTSTLKPSLGDRLTQTLTNEVVKFLAQVESFEGLVQEGRLVPQDQLQGFWRLKEEQDALERAFLWARGEHKRAQQLQASEMPPGEFDPNREVEGEIFRLGMRLEELMDEIDDLGPNQQFLRTLPQEKSRASSVASPISDVPTLSPALSAQAPMPTARTPYPENSAIQNDHTFLCGADAEVSSASGESEDESPELQEPLQFKQDQMEKDFHSLMAQYHSIKSLPDDAKLEEDQEEKDCTPEVDGPISGNPKAFELGSRRTEQEEEMHLSPLEECMEESISIQPPELHSSLENGGPQLGGLPQSLVSQTHPPAAPKLTPPVSEEKQPPYHQSSITSLAGSGVSGSLPLQKPFHSTNGNPQLTRNFDAGQYKEHWIVSPGTDSGFVGSETSRISPLTQTPEHRLSHLSMSFGTSDLRRLPQSSTACLPQAPPSHHPGRDQLVIGVSSGLSTSGAHAQRSDPMSVTTPKKWTKGFRHKMGPGTKMADLDGEAHDGVHEGYSHGREDDRSPAPTPSDEAHQDPEQDPLSNLISREMRDQAIRALQQEVTRLREKIEASLTNPSQDSSSHSLQQATRARSRFAKDSLISGGPFHTSKYVERYQGDRGDTAQNNRTVRLRMRSSSVPREGPQPTQSSESERSGSRIQAEESRAGEQSRRREGAREKQKGTICFLGHYTGQEYSVTSSQHNQTDNNSLSCSCCHTVRKKISDNAPSKDSEKTFPRDSLKKTQCPMCHRPRSPTERSKESSGIDKSTQKGASLSSGLIRKSEQRQQQSSPPSLSQPPAVWYLASPLQTPAGAAVAYVPSVPVVPYSPSRLYYSPAAPTSASSPPHYPSGKKPAEVRPSTQSRGTPTPTAGHRGSSELDLIDLNRLSQSLSQAVEAARNVELTTKQMTRSLSADLHRARGLRGSCLF